MSQNTITSGMLSCLLQSSEPQERRRQISDSKASICRPQHLHRILLSPVLWRPWVVWQPIGSRFAALKAVERGITSPFSQELQVKLGGALKKETRLYDIVHEELFPHPAISHLPARHCEGNCQQMDAGDAGSRYRRIKQCLRWRRPVRTSRLKGRCCVRSRGIRDLKRRKQENWNTWNRKKIIHIKLLEKHR